MTSTYPWPKRSNKEINSFTKMNKEPNTESIEEYWELMHLTCEMYGYNNPTEPGTMPPTLQNERSEYKLLDNFHGYTCDSVHCQKLFEQSEDDVKALLYTSLPIYTKLKEHELCIVCIQSATQ